MTILGKEIKVLQALTRTPTEIQSEEDLQSLQVVCELKSTLEEVKLEGEKKKKKGKKRKA